jgi:hypothetical protein
VTHLNVAESAQRKLRDSTPLERLAWIGSVSQTTNAWFGDCEDMSLNKVSDDLATFPKQHRPSVSRSLHESTAQSTVVLNWTIIAQASDSG